MSTTYVSAASALVAMMMVFFAFAGSASALSVTCSGVPSSNAIAWSASASDGVQPFAYLWSNGATTSSQTVTVSPGAHTMTLQVTDASSTVASTTCSATVAAPSAPLISSFTASPSAIQAGQSATLAWTVSNASTTSINNGVGAVSSTSVSVSPSVTTTYTLTAMNPGGTTTANATVTVVASSTPGSVFAQIQALLSQINALRAQIAALLTGQAGSGNGNGTGTMTPACFNFWRDLKEGDSGDDVRALQQQLAKDDPTIFPPGLATGFFGPRTLAAVKMWQRRYGVDSVGTGFFGMRSRGHYAALCSNGDADKDGIRNSDDPDDDNDGVLDADDRWPFLNASSTRAWDDDVSRRNNGDRGRGNGRDDDDDDDRGRNDD